MLTDGLEWSGLLVVFLSAVWTLVLAAPIRCRGSIAEDDIDSTVSPILLVLDDAKT